LCRPDAAENRDTPRSAVRSGVEQAVIVRSPGQKRRELGEGERAATG